MRNSEKKALNALASKAKATGIKGVAAAVLAVIALNSVVTVNSGETVRIQNQITGNHTWYQDEGIKFKVPFFSKVVTYNSVSTVAVTDDEALIDTASTYRLPLVVGFADNYTGRIEASWRLKLPTDDKSLEAMHQDVKTQANLEGNTYLTFAKDMLNLTSDQFLAQDFMQGGKGAFKQRLVDQAEHGMLVTKREKVMIDGQVADQSLKGERSQAASAKQYAYKVVTQLKKDGTPMRRPHSLAKYGITVTQVDMGEFVPSKDLTSYVSTIKHRERERAALIADQRTERQKAVTEQLKGDRERITAKNKALMAKDQEVIQGQKRVELAEIQATQEKVERQKVADLAKIDKQREKDIATANLGIQKANAAAARYEAQALKEKGFAEASVAKAKLAAKQANKDIYLAEINRDVQIAKAKYMTQTKLDMPNTVIVNGSSQGGDTTKDLLNMKLVNDVTK